jgi:membrane protein implicated in regulation of membrane protease activity
MDWYGNLPLFQQILWGVVVFFTTIWAIQAILRLVGLGDHDIDHGIAHGVDHDVDHGGHGSDASSDGPGMHVFEASNLVLFFAAFGWITLSGIWSGMADLNAAILGFFVAAVLVVCVAWVWFKLYGLSSSGTMKLRNAVGAIGKVYYPIPPAGEGRGAVLVTVQGQRRELPAITKDVSVTEPIPTGTEIRVIDISGSGTLLVAPARVLYSGDAASADANEGA